MGLQNLWQQSHKGANLSYLGETSYGQTHGNRKRNK